MSPRRKVDADERDFFAVTPKPPRRWGLPVIATLAALLIAAAIARSMFMLDAYMTRTTGPRSGTPRRWATCGSS